MLVHLCKNCGHPQEDHYNGWAECLECNCVMFEYGRLVEVEEEDTPIEVLTAGENGV